MQAFFLDCIIECSYRCYLAVYPVFPVWLHFRYERHLTHPNEFFTSSGSMSSPVLRRSCHGYTHGHHVVKKEVIEWIIPGGALNTAMGF